MGIVIDHVYHALPLSQVLKLRTLLRAVGLGGVNVGSIDDFQGQEMKVIFISTVLSSVPGGDDGGGGEEEGIDGEEASAVFAGAGGGAAEQQQQKKKKKKKTQQQRRGAAGNLHGFLGDPKRFNVAVTRAKALTVVVGHPVVLLQDTYWGALLKCVHAAAAAAAAATATAAAAVAACGAVRRCASLCGAASCAPPHRAAPASRFA